MELSCGNYKILRGHVGSAHFISSKGNLLSSHSDGLFQQKCFENQALSLIYSSFTEFQKYLNVEKNIHFTFCRICRIFWD
jgi:hypothetical protein